MEGSLHVLRMVLSWNLFYSKKFYDLIMKPLTHEYKFLISYSLSAIRKYPDDCTSDSQKLCYSL